MNKPFRLTFPIEQGLSSAVKKKKKKSPNIAYNLCCKKYCTLKEDLIASQSLSGRHGGRHAFEGRWGKIKSGD